MENKELEKQLRQIIEEPAPLKEGLVYSRSGSNTEKLEAPGLASGSLSDLQELRAKVESCLSKQKELRFIMREISDLIKKSY